MKTLRLCTAIAIAASAVAAAQITNPAPASADPAPTAGYLYNLGLTSATSMVTAHNKLFIGSGNAVLIRSLAGAPIGSVAGTSGVTDLLVSPDGNTVYAADNSASSITAIDAGSGTASATYPVSACPSQLAWSSGRVFFSHGCLGSPGTIASIDAASGGTPVDSGITTSFEVAPMLAGVDGRIVASVNQSSLIYSYTASGAALTESASTNYGSNIFDLAISPDGSSVAATENAPYQVHQFDAATLATTASYPTGPYPSAVSYGHDHLLAGGLDASYSASIRVYNTTSGSEVSAIQPSIPGLSVPATMPNTLTFGPDLAGRPESIVYGLASDVYGHIYLEAAPTGPLSIPHLTLGVGSPKAYGQPLAVAVTFPGHPNTALTLRLLPNSGVASSVAVRTNQWGVASVAVRAYFSGRIYAYYGGDLLTRREGPNTSAIHAFTVPSHTSASMLGAYKVSGGVQHFRAAANVHLHIVVGPPHVRSVTVVLQYFSSGAWHSVPSATFSTNQWGTTELYLVSGSRNVLYRTVVSTPTTVFNTGSSMIAAAFKIG